MIVILLFCFGIVLGIAGMSALMVVLIALDTNEEINDERSRTQAS